LIDYTVKDFGVCCTAQCYILHSGHRGRGSTGLARLPSTSATPTSLSTEHLGHDLQFMQLGIHNLFGFRKNLNELSSTFPVLLCHERVRGSTVVLPTSSSNSVDVILILHGVIVVHHEFDVVHIFQATGELLEVIFEKSSLFRPQIVKTPAEHTHVTCGKQDLKDQARPVKSLASVRHL